MNYAPTISESDYLPRELSTLRVWKVAAMKIGERRGTVQRKRV